jgi:ParB family chromosome partitioning protein
VAETSRGLGRGLAALIDPTSAGTPRLLHLELDRIEPNPRQPRRHIDPDRLADLAASVRQDGIVQPVVVRDRHDGSYELIAGERRWRAARAAGLITIPAVVRTADDRESLVLALVENVVREDLNAVEVARGYAALVDEGGLSAAEVAARVGKSRTAVTNTLRLLELPDDVLDLVRNGTITEGHGRAILQAPEHTARRLLARRVVREELSVRRTEAAARATATGAGRRRSGRSPEWLDQSLADDVVDACYRALGRQARVVPSPAGVRVELALGSFDDVTDLVQTLEHLAAQRYAAPST